ncbi:MAG: hypothetical protein AMS23_06955 [Bacteroides sp. SM1_62]|nr:MAG: hypothetical protein AMS23_06955 [Bacteroides sp. SM1_62]
MPDKSVFQYIFEKRLKFMKQPLILTICILFIHPFAMLAQDEINLNIYRDYMSLNGVWEFIENHPDEEVFKESVAKAIGDWQMQTIPGNFLPWEDQEKIRNNLCIWTRRGFTIPADQTGKDVVLNWNGIHFGAEAWINEIFIGSHVPTGPHSILIPGGTVQDGINTITLKLIGWAGLEKGVFDPQGDPPSFGYPAMPVGASHQGWGGKSPGIYDDIWMEFYEQVYMKYILAIPDIDNEQVTFRIWLDGHQKLPAEVNAYIKVRSKQSHQILSESREKLTGTRNYQEIILPLEDPLLWSTHDRNLYRADLEIGANGTLCDRASFHFGMRKIEVKNGDYYLNNQRIRFHGSNLVHEWHWGYEENIFNENIKRYIVDEAKVMNLNSFRTHTRPPPASWLDTCDTYGTMMIAELPILFNYHNPGFNAGQWEKFRKYALQDATGWITRIWNHPSIMIWVLSNESPYDSIWEETVLRDHVLSYDPSRPAFRTGENTLETLDIHPCSNYDDMMEGGFFDVMEKHSWSIHENQTKNNSEYMNLFKPLEKITEMYLGSKDHPYARLNMAEIALEHTEIMRQRDYDMILPYMYAGWTGLRGNSWRTDFPTPMAAALHSSMSPVLASLECWNRNFICGENISIPLHLINDLYVEVQAVIELCLTESDPLFVPDEDSLKRQVWKDSFNQKFDPLSHNIKEIQVSLPGQPGVYYLSAILYRDGDRPVTSQRVIRTISRPARNGEKNILVLGEDKELESWLMANDYAFHTDMTHPVQPDIILLGKSKNISESSSFPAAKILETVNKGSRLIILHQTAWNCESLADFAVAENHSRTRAFMYTGTESPHPMFDGIGHEYLKRWNGQPFNVVANPISGSFVDSADKLVWAENPETVYVARKAYGDGEIIVSQLLLREHALKMDESYDPAAERILLNLLTY